MSSVVMECYIYVVWVGMLQIFGGLLLVPFFVPLGNRLGLTSFSEILKGYLIFNAFLLLWGCLGNLVFHTIAFNRFYVSVDRMVDCIPFIPFGQWVLDQSIGERHGRLLGGTTIWHLRLLWLVVVVPVWLLTFLSTSNVYRLLFNRGRVVHA